MAKLIIKHELPPPTPLEKLADVLQTVLPVALVVVAIAVAVSLYLSSSSGTGSKTVTVMPSPAVTTQLPDSYLNDESQLNAMALEFENLLDASKEDRDKHQQLVNKAEAILAQLTTMDDSVTAMALPEEDKQILHSRHQYQKDYWESKLVFHRLRMARFNINDASSEVKPDTVQPDDTAATVTHEVSAPDTSPEAPPATEEKGVSIDKPGENAVPPAVAETSDAAAQQGDTVAADGNTETKTAPTPPPDVKLPEGFCPLFGPGAAECKANAKKH